MPTRNDGGRALLYGKFCLTGWMLLWMLPAMVAILAAYDSAGGSKALSATESKLGSQQPTATSSMCSTGNLFKIENHNSYPIWLGEYVADVADVVAPASGWKIPAGHTTSICTTPPWVSGRLWARTECDFDDLYQSGAPTGPTTRSVPFTTCNADTDCPAASGGISYDCFGGVCMVDCTSANDKTNAFCQSNMGTPGNTNAICSTNTNSNGAFNVCTYSGGTVCKTGDCDGLYQCEGNWTNSGNLTSTSATGAPPASLFEPTSNSLTDVNYDVSNVGGYNSAIRVTVSPQTTPNNSYPDNCDQPKCVSDLNTTCPVNLQVTEAPGTTVGPVQCGRGTGLYCQSGACEPCQAGSGQSCDANNKKTCVIGCNDPGDQCTANPANAANLSCSTPIPNPADGSWTADGSTYFDMYQSTDESGLVNPNTGTALSSQNQGNPVCWTHPGFANSNVDCTPDQVCDTADFKTLGFPKGVGVCVYKKAFTPPGIPGGLVPQIHCGAAADPGKVGDACGGYYTANSPPLYPDALGYTCHSVNITVGGHNAKNVLACLPAFGADAVVGLGDYETASEAGHSPLFTGSGSMVNPEWHAAAKWATGNGTKPGKPFYEYFSRACPHAYAWTYDDNAGGLSCNSAAPGGNSENVNFTIAFGPPSSLVPTPTATPTATASSTATATSAATPTATASPTTRPRPQRRPPLPNGDRDRHSNFNRIGRCHADRDANCNGDRDCNCHSEPQRVADSHLRPQLLPDNQSCGHARLRRCCGQKHRQ